MQTFRDEFWPRWLHHLGWCVGPVDADDAGEELQAAHATYQTWWKIQVSRFVPDHIVSWACKWGREGLLGCLLKHNVWWGTFCLAFSGFGTFWWCPICKTQIFYPPAPCLCIVPKNRFYFYPPYFDWFLIWMKP